MSAFSIDSTLDADQGVLSVVGEVDLYTADQVAACGVEALDNPAVELLVLDLAAVSFLDSTGIGALIRIRNAALDCGKQLVIRRPSPSVLRILTIAGLTTIFRLDPPSGDPDGPRPA
ncbi:MAG: STAS domain-containing protein [Jatrophihabitantaceae bacterium]